MKSRDSALRLRQFEAEEKARRVRDLEQMIREFEHMATDLNRQVEAEEIRTAIRDKSHFAYSTFAKAAALRRDNLMASAAEFKAKLDVAGQERDAAMERLAQAHASAGRVNDVRSRRRIERMPAVVVARGSL